MAFTVRKPQESQKVETLEVSEMQQTEQKLLSIVDEQASLIDEQTEQIRILTCETESLQQKLQSANAHIEKLAGSDLELQQSQRNNEEAQEVLRLAEEQMQNAQRMRGEAETMRLNVEKDRANLTQLIERRLQEAVDRWIDDNTKTQEAALQNLRRTESLYSPYLFVLLSYGILVTWFFALTSAECQAAWVDFSQSIGLIGMRIWSGLQGATMWAAQLSQYVPDADCAVAVRWLIIIGVFSGIGTGVTVLTRMFRKQFIQFFCRHLADRHSILIYLGATAAGIFLAGPIQDVFRINSFWLAILLSAGYILVRSIWIIGIQHSYR